MPNADDDLFTHRPLTDDPGWFDRFYMNVHSPAGGITISHGMGRYPQAGVVDGFAMLVDRGQQRNFRASREGDIEERKLEAGPLSAEITEPLKRWRIRLAPNDAKFSYDLEFEGDLAPIDAGRIERRSRKTGALLDFSHFVQVGRVHGTLEIDGVKRELERDSWFGLRDRSWGVRPGAGDQPPAASEAPHPTAGKHDWVCARVGDHAVFYMIAGGGSRGPHFLGGGLSDARGEIKLASVERVLDWDERGFFRGARAELRTESGETIELRASAPAATLYLRGGLYGGWRGMRQGMRRGGLVCEADRWTTSDPKVLAEVSGLNDHVVRFESARGDGFGIYEVASGF
jgi:hypothetical protein